MTRVSEDPLDPPSTSAERTRAEAINAARTDADAIDAERTDADAAHAVTTGEGGSDAGRPGGTANDRSAGTARNRAKAERRAALLAAAARLFAERGFDGVTLGDIGEAAGVSGPAVYRHVAGKQALLGAILVDVSERLLEGGRRVAAVAAYTSGRPADGSADTPSPAASQPRVEADVRATALTASPLPALIDFHVAFALAEADVIRVQDRDLDRLASADRRRVRDLQNAYVDVWVDALARRFPDAETPAERRVRALACFGLINSTPHSVRGIPAARVRPTLTRMALAALEA